MQAAVEDDNNNSSDASSGGSGSGSDNEQPDNQVQNTIKAGKRCRVWGGKARIYKHPQGDCPQVLTQSRSPKRNPSLSKGVRHDL